MMCSHDDNSTMQSSVVDIPHYGSSALLINGDKKSPAYGRLLMVRERGTAAKPRLAGKISPPGGSREHGEDFINTAVREIAEEATSGDEATVTATIAALYDPDRCRFDLQASHKFITHPGRPPRVVGKLLAVLFDGSLFPGLTTELPDNREISARMWMTLAEIRNLGDQYRFAHQIEGDIEIIRRVARHYDVKLA